jgi:hypothetical protein
MQITAAGLAVSDVINASSLFHHVTPFSSAFFLFMCHLVSLSSFLSLYSIISHIFSPFFFLSLCLFPLFSHFLSASRFLLASPFPLASFTSSFPHCLRRSAARQYAAGV